MIVSETGLEGVRIVQAPRYRDERGWFSELWNAERYPELGVDATFVQHNVSFSEAGVLRGLHYQWPNPQGKLISVLAGSVFDAVVDVRVGSPTFGRWFGTVLSAEKALQLWVPEGFAHGLLAMEAGTLVHYACTRVYDADCERTLAWDDPDIGIAWPFPAASLSDKDRGAPLLRGVDPRNLPTVDPRDMSRLGT